MFVELRGAGMFQVEMRFKTSALPKKYIESLGMAQRLGFRV